MTRFLLAAALFAAAPLARAGLHASIEEQNPLPANWAGFLPDHRALRLVAAPAAGGTAFADRYAAARKTLETAAGPLTADQAADLGAVYVRFGQIEKALGVLRPARRTHPDHFRLAANLGTAWHLAGDFEQSLAALDDAVRLVPAKLRPSEEAHRTLVKLRAKEPRGAADTAPDDIFGVAFGPGLPAKLPANAAAVAQQLALWYPADGRLLWLLAEVAAASGDVRTAANILDGCVTEFGMKSAVLRTRRQQYRTAADALPAGGHAEHRGTIAFASARPLARTFDASKLPPIKPDGVNPLPWAALAETLIVKPFKPRFLPHVLDLDGKKVAVVGFMRPPAGGGPELTSFLMTEYPVGCWFCESPDPAMLLGVELAAGKTAAYTRGAFKVEGVLKLNRADPEAYLYTLEDARISAAD